jgi:hypothetical protein
MLNLAEQAFRELPNISKRSRWQLLSRICVTSAIPGAIYGFEQYSKDSSFFENRRSFVEGLYFAGSWVAPGVPDDPAVRCFRRPRHHEIHK